MAYIFGDGFDCYAAPADALAGYWDSGTFTINGTLVAGRFVGSQAFQAASFGAVVLTKSSGVNDAVHHIVMAYRQTAALSGTTLGLYLQFIDGTTNQCCIVFRSDGVILLQSGAPGGTTLATYSGAVTAQNTWFAFEFEVVVNNTTGSFTARKNGNTSNDFTLGSLNTRGGTANNYANKLTINQSAAVNAVQFDDVLWRSDAASVAWVGDIRCYTRMPASDATAVFSKSPATIALTPFTTAATTGFASGTAYYTPFTSSVDGTIGSAVLSVAVGYTGNLKCAIFASSGTVPTTVVGTATPISNPASGNNTFTFSTPPVVTRGTQYWIGLDGDTSSGSFNRMSPASGFTSTTSYASFPVASPGGSAIAGPVFTMNISVTTNNCLVNEAQQDGATSYVYDSNVNDADFYNIAALSGTPSSTVAVTTRGFVEKSDAGTRNGAVQLKSGATTVTSTSTALSTSWNWLWRTDTVDPNTGAAWTATGVNNATIGAIVTV